MLLVTDEAGNIALRERTTTPAHCHHPLDGFLMALGLTPVTDWRPGEGGPFSCEVVAAPEQESTLRAALEEKMPPGAQVRAPGAPGAR